MPTKIERKHRLLGLVLFVALLLFGNLGSNGLLEDNEARFFEISWHMFDSGDWITPKLNHIIHFHKPPLTFWAVAGSLNIFGSNEWAGRLPVALASCLILTLVYWWRSEPETTFKERALPVLILVSCVEFWFLSRLVLTDMFLAAAVVLNLFAFWRLRESDALKWTLLFWLAQALSFLTKGPVGLAIVALTILGFRGFGGKVPWKKMFRWQGLLLGAAVVTPWYATVFHKYPNLFYYLFEFQTVERVATEVHGRGGPIWFFLPVILAGFFPWSFSLWVSVKKAWKERDEFDLFLWAWLLCPLVLFSLSGSKLPTYILPLFPALAMITARTFLNQKTLNPAGWSSVVGLGIFATALALFLVGKVPPEIVPAFQILEVVCAVAWVGAVAGGISMLKQDPPKVALITGVSFGLVLHGLSWGLGPCDEAFSAREVSKFILSKTQPDSVVAEYKDHLHGLPYYLRRRMVQIAYPRELLFEPDLSYKQFLFDDIESFRASLPEGRHVVILLNDSDYDAEKFRDYKTHQIGKWYLLED